MAKSRLTLDVLWKVLLVITLLIFGLVHASSILIPLIFSLFIAVLLNPMVSFLERRIKFPKILAILTVLIVVFITVSAAIYFMSSQAKGLLEDLPSMVTKFNSLVEEIGKKLYSITGLSADEQINFIKKNSGKILSSSSFILTSTFYFTTSFIASITLVPIYVFFFLLYKANFKKFLLNLGKENKSRHAIEIAEEVSDMVQAYIVGLLIVTSIIALLNIIGLLSLGIKYAVFLAIFSSILTVIPYVGILLGGSLSVLVALITTDSLFYPLGVVAIYSFVQFLEGNLITPKVIGSKVNVNPMAAIIALIIGGKIWGILGMVIAIPLTGVLKIIFSHYPRLQPYAILLQSTDKDSEQEDLKKLRERRKEKRLNRKEKLKKKEELL